MATLLADPFHMQLVLGFGLGALALLSVLRPDAGLAISGFGLVFMGASLYAELGPTSPQLTTAALYLVGGLIASGLAGMTRTRRIAPAARPRAFIHAGEPDRPSAYNPDFLDDILESPAHRDQGNDVYAAESPEPRRLPASLTPSARRRSTPPATNRTNAWN